jgi:hypothetical protein
MPRGRPKVVPSAEEIFELIPNKFKTFNKIPLSKLGTVKWVVVAYKCESDMSKAVLLNKRLFGFYEKGKYHDGVLDRWENGKRVPRIEYDAVSKATYVMPEEVWNVLRDNLFKPLDIKFDVREVGSQLDLVIEPDSWYGVRIPGKPRKIWRTW